MKRRNFLKVLASAPAWPLAASAQPRTIPSIGFLSSGSPRAFGRLIAAFRQGLGEQGYAEGRNVWIDYRWAEGHYNELGELAADLIRNKVTLIAATGGVVSAQAAVKATARIPIVFVVGFDPVQLGLVARINRPGGNATGASVFTTELAAKRLELLSRLAPGIRNIGILVNPESATTELETKDTIAAAEKVGRPLMVLKASTDSEINEAFDSASRQHVSALLVSADPLFTTRGAQLVALAARHAIPTMYSFREFVEAGGLISYGSELTWAYHQIGVYAGRILKGDKPADLPVVMPTKFDLVINLKTVKALGLDVSPQLLALVDGVVE